MGRPFDFTPVVKESARKRQKGLCAVCGEKLAELLDLAGFDTHAHHVVPNQSGRADDKGQDWIRSEDNCVLICKMCHDRVHQDGRFREGAVAPPSYFPFSHGRKTASHEAWAAKIESLLKTVWS